MGRIAAVEIPFCERTIYNLVVDLFYVPPSPVIGCHWSCVRGKRLHGSFSDFPGDFFSHCILRLWCSNRYATVVFLWKKQKLPVIRSINVSPHSPHSAARSPGWQEERFNFVSIWPLHTQRAAPTLLRGVAKMHRVGKPGGMNMDYLPAAGKLSALW